MPIKKIDIEYISISGFSSFTSDGVKHTKVLPYLSVVQAVEGNYDICLGNDGTYNTGIGGFFIAPSGVQQTIIHNADKINGRMTCRWIFLKIKINDIFYLDDIYRFPTILPDRLKNEMNVIFNRVFKADNAVDRYICYYQIVKLLLSVGSEKENRVPSSIVSALTYIENHYMEKITVQDIAHRVNLSASYFFSVFKKQMGISPVAYLNNYRLSLAAELLLKTDATITEVANSVGISDAVYFNKMFKSAYQIPPSEYRKHYKAQIGIVKKHTHLESP